MVVQSRNLHDIIQGQVLSIMALLFYLLLFLAVVSFSYVFWLRLREDYSSDQIFSMTLLCLFGGLLGWIIFDRWLPSLSFWGFIVGAGLFGLYAIRKMEIRLLEALDGVVLGFVWFSLFFYLGDIVRVGAAAFSLQTRFVDLVVFLPSITSLLVFYLYLRNYRRFSWYPSGKLGFIGGGLASLYFTLRALVDFYLFWVLSFSSLIFDSVLSLLVSAVFAGIVYLRSGRAGAYRIIEIFRFKKRTSFRN